MTLPNNPEDNARKLPVYNPQDKVQANTEHKAYSPKPPVSLEGYEAPAISKGTEPELCLERALGCGPCQLFKGHGTITAPHANGHLCSCYAKDGHEVVNIKVEQAPLSSPGKSVDALFELIERKIPEHHLKAEFIADCKQAIEQLIKERVVAELKNIPEDGNYGEEGEAVLYINNRIQELQDE